MSVNWPKSAWLEWTHGNRLHNGAFFEGKPVVDSGVTFEWMPVKELLGAIRQQESALSMSERMVADVNWFNSEEAGVSLTELRAVQGVSVPLLGQSFSHFGDGAEQVARACGIAARFLHLEHRLQDSLFLEQVASLNGEEGELTVNALGELEIGLCGLFQWTSPPPSPSVCKQLSDRLGWIQIEVESVMEAIEMLQGTSHLALSTYSLRCIDLLMALRESFKHVMAVSQNNQGLAYLRARLDEGGFADKAQLFTEHQERLIVLIEKMDAFFVSHASAAQKALRMKYDETQKRGTQPPCRLLVAKESGKVGVVHVRDIAVPTSIPGVVEAKPTGIMKGFLAPEEKAHLVAWSQLGEECSHCTQGNEGVETRCWKVSSQERDKDRSAWHQVNAVAGAYDRCITQFYQQYEQDPFIRNMMARVIEQEGQLWEAAVLGPGRSTENAAGLTRMVTRCGAVEGSEMAVEQAQVMATRAAVVVNLHSFAEGNNAGGGAVGELQQFLPGKK